MSQENVQEFFNKVNNDSALGEEYKTFLQSCKVDNLSEKEVLEKIVSFGKEKGYTFSTEDLKSFSKSKEYGELTEGELDAVAGGKGGYTPPPPPPNPNPIKKPW